jgi:hypothetical protein
VQKLNADRYLAHSDWRLPNIKELQSIVDYSRSPSSTGSAAINPIFSISTIQGEAGVADYPFFWSGTTHQDSFNNGNYAMYVCFGSGLGCMGGEWVDIHGAGSQRSDPKTGSASRYPQGHGPQGDAIRILNYVRPVRGGTAVLTIPTVPVLSSPIPMGPQFPGMGPGPDPHHTGGRVDSVQGLIINISNPTGRYVIRTTDSTRFLMNGNPATIADLNAGLFIEVDGAQQNDGSWLATDISISDHPMRGPGAPPPGGNPEDTMPPP